MLIGQRVSARLSGSFPSTIPDIGFIVNQTPDAVTRQEPESPQVPEAAFPDLMSVVTTAEFQARVELFLVALERDAAQRRYVAELDREIANLDVSLALPFGVDVDAVKARRLMLVDLRTEPVPDDQVSRSGIRQVPVDLVAAAVLQELLVAHGRARDVSDPTDDEMWAALAEIIRRNPFHGGSSA